MSGLSSFYLPDPLSVDHLTDDPEENLAHLISRTKRKPPPSRMGALVNQGIINGILHGLKEQYETSPNTTARFYVIALCHYPQYDEKNFANALDLVSGQDSEVIQAIRKHHEAIKHLMPRNLTLHSSMSDVKIEVNKWLFEKSSSFGETGVKWGDPVQAYGSQNSLLAFRNYIETGSIELDEYPVATQSNLVRLAHMYHITDLLTHLSKRLPPKVNGKNALEFLRAGIRYEQPNLKAACIAYLNRMSGLTMDGDHLILSADHKNILKAVPALLPIVFEVTLTVPVLIEKTWPNVKQLNIHYKNSDWEPLAKTFPNVTTFVGAAPPDGVFPHKAVVLPKNWLTGKSTREFHFPKQPKSPLLIYLIRKRMAFTAPGITFSKHGPKWCALRIDRWSEVTAELVKFALPSCDKLTVGLQKCPNALKVPIQQLHLTHSSPDYGTFQQPQVLIQDGKLNFADIKKTFPNLPVLAMKTRQSVTTVPANVIVFDVAKAIKGSRVIRKTKLTAILRNPTVKNRKVGGNLPAEAFVYLAENKTGKITHWDLSQCRDLDARAILQIIHYCPEIKVLDLSYCPHVTSQLFTGIKTCFEKLILNYCSQLSNLDDLPFAGELSLVGCEKITDDHIEAYQGLHHSDGFGIEITK